MNILDDFQDFNLESGGTTGLLNSYELGLSGYDLDNLQSPQDEGLYGRPAASTDSKGLFSVGVGTWERNVTRSIKCFTS